MDGEERLLIFSTSDLQHREDCFFVFSSVSLCLLSLKSLIFIYQTQWCDLSSGCDVSVNVSISASGLKEKEQLPLFLSF